MVHILFLEGESDYFMRINQLINVVIDYDLPEAKAMEVTTLAKLKKLLYVISTSVPFTANIIAIFLMQCCEWYIFSIY